MPYIKQYSRDELDPLIEDLTKQIGRIGDLNYVITSLLIDYAGDNPRYKDYNELIGVLECAKLEFYRRAVSSYEDEKCYDEGDVY